MRSLSMVRRWALIGSMACSACAPTPPPRIEPASQVPALFDLSVAPVRPSLVFRGEPMKVVPGKDTATGAPQLDLQPDLPDTNDARSYYAAGMASIYSNPSGASAAFYWASRINPGWADPYFARWFTLNEARQPAIRQLPDSVERQIDSLVVAAFIRDPFFDERLVMNEFSSQYHQRARLAQRQANAATQRANLRLQENGRGPLLTAPHIVIPHNWYLAFAERNFASASRDLAELINQKPDALELYVYRAKAQYYLTQYDSAAATLQAAAGRIATREAARTLPVYFSRDLFYYGAGMADLEARRDTAARSAFESAVTENLGNYMGHLHLAVLALRYRDTTPALAEAGIAAQIRPTDPLAQFYLAVSLLNARRATEAVEHLRLAIAADPYFALSYYYLGQACDAVHDTAGSREGYRSFLAHAARGDTLRAYAQRAFSRLGGS